MGILERLGLRKLPSDDFSQWLGTTLETLFTSEAASGASQELFSGLIEVDARIAEFVGKHGVEALEAAVDQWVERRDAAVIVSSLSVFLIPTAVRPLLAAFEARKGKPAQGLTALHGALERLGVLAMSEMKGDPGWEPEARTAIYQMLEVMWPFAKTEEALRVRIFGLTRADTRLIKWELFTLRNWALNLVISAAFRSDPARGADMKAKLFKQLEARSADVAEPADTENWLKNRFAGYSAAIRPVEVEGQELTRVIPTTIGRQFARNFKSSNIELRSIGARVFAEAYGKLGALVRAWQKNP